MEILDISCGAFAQMMIQGQYVQKKEDTYE